MDNIKAIRIWSDGARVGDPAGGPGGWAYVKKWGEKTHTDKGRAPARVTNIQMEMVAAIQALRSLKRRDVPTVVYTDLEMLSNGVSLWLDGWIAKGWRKADKKPVENRELWEALKALIDERDAEAPITFVWIRGHDGVEENELADKLAEGQARLAAKVPGAPDMPARFDREVGLMVPVFEMA